MLDDGRDLAETIEAVKENGRGALHLAAINGHTKVCKYLIEEIRLGINSLSDGQFETPIYLATFHGEVGTAMYLFVLGADCAKGNKSGKTPLHQAAGKGYCYFVHLLLSRQIYVDIEDSCGLTPLHVAAGCGQVSTTNILLEREADPRKVSLNGFSPLMMSVLAGSLQCVEKLIMASADVNDNNSHGVNSLGLAAHGGLTEIIELLLKAGADPNIHSTGGPKPIELAAVFGKRHDVEILFPSTSPIPSVPEWSVDGIITDLRSKVREQKAMLLDPFDAEIYYGRSCCWHRLAVGDRALMDANICKILEPGKPWPYFREGSVLYLLEEYKRAAYAFLDALELEPGKKEIENSLKKAIKSMEACTMKR